MKLSGDFFNVDSADGQRFTVTLNADHYIYRAHFPGHPVTPGVCLVQMVQELLAQSLGCGLFLRTVKNVKFVSIVSPLTDAKIAVNVTKLNVDEGQVTAQAQIVSAADSARLFTKMSLVFERI